MEVTVAGTAGLQVTQRALLDFPGFAQEFLRRNPAYVRDYDCVMTGGRRGDIAAREAMARRWGLCFPMSAVPLGARKSCALVGGDLRLHQHPRRGAAGMPGG
ncbi:MULTISPECIES: transcriptional regulator domain-containing protein [Sphingomonadales]|jgi:hypothetical protein|uniref:transcriptional regulator domain-containing protein n=1 Tax=Sphingomonadales TaxID=204457 RepID=UPI0007378DA3|nr:MULTISPECIES: DUF6499 domain-containing protein [Sphingopyxis]KTE18359.1 hypothetical protein ATE67_18620 [Sphingopyxis sp. H050]